MRSWKRNGAKSLRRSSHRLSRRLLQDAPGSSSDAEPQYFAVTRNPLRTGLTETARLRAKHKGARLTVLGRMGPAESTGPSHTQQVTPGFRAGYSGNAANFNDRQRTLAAHGAVVSDGHTPVEVLDPMNMTSVEGQVLVHGGTNKQGANYLMLEGTDAKVHYIHYTPEMERPAAAANCGPTRSYV